MASASALLARDVVPTVSYLPSLKLVEGDQPLSTSYVLTVTAPGNVIAGSTVTVTPVVTAVSAPTGVSIATALSCVTLSQGTLVFTAPGQTQTLTVSVSVPSGTAAGDYVWNIATSGWASGTLDPFASINAKVTIPQTSSAPAVTISGPLDGTVFNQLYSALPITVPLNFSATAPAISPITSIDADVNGSAVTLSSTGLGTPNVQAGGSISLTAAGVYTVRARATNNAGTSSSTVEVTVNVQAPAPVVTITQPAVANFAYTGTTLSIPYAFTATSAFGAINSVAATVNGTPLTVAQGGIGSLQATGSGTITVNAAGTYTLAATATSASGTTSVSKTFSVSAAQSTPSPTVQVAQPLNGAAFTRTAGNPATMIPFAFSATAGAGATISSIAATLNGNSVALAPSGVGTAAAGGSGNFSITTPGNYTFVASAISGGLSDSQSVSFTVTEAPAPAPDCTINWLTPIVLGKVQQGGSVLPIRFTIDCCCWHCGGDRVDRDCDERHRRAGPRGQQDCENEHDTSVVVFIYEIKADGTTTEPAIFSYSRRGKNSWQTDTYEIDGNHYHLNFDTAAGEHRYHIDVYRTNAGTGSPQLLGTREFTTK